MHRPRAEVLDEDGANEEVPDGRLLLRLTDLRSIVYVDGSPNSSDVF